jgi:hypothetical protein
VIGYGRNKTEIDIAEIDEAAVELRLEVDPLRPVESASSQERPKRGGAIPSARQPTEHIETSGPSSRRNLPLALAAILLAALVLVSLGFGGGRWKKGLFESRLESLGSAMGHSLDSVANTESASADDEMVVVSNSPHAMGTPEGVQAAASVRPKIDDLPGLIQKSEEVARWLADSQTVYSVHVASFHSAERAEIFMRDLIELNSDWDAPLYLEWNEDGDEWYRVLSGGFLNSNDARIASRAYHARPGIGYAQLARLSANAQELLPGGARSLDRGKGSADE